MIWIGHEWKSSWKNCVKLNSIFSVISDLKHMTISMNSFKKLFDSLTDECFKSAMGKSVKFKKCQNDKQEDRGLKMKCIIRIYDITIDNENNTRTCGKNYFLNTKLLWKLVKW